MAAGSIPSISWTSPFECGSRRRCQGKDQAQFYCQKQEATGPSRGGGIRARRARAGWAGQVSPHRHCWSVAGMQLRYPAAQGKRLLAGANRYLAPVVG